MTTTVTPIVSVRTSGSATKSASFGISSGVPTLNFSAQGSASVSVLAGNIATIDSSYSTEVPEGYTLQTSNKQATFKDATDITGAITFNISGTLSVGASPAINGTVTFNVSMEKIEDNVTDQYDRFVSIANPSIAFEKWFFFETHLRYKVEVTGGVGGAANELKTTTTGSAYSYVETSGPETPPAPPTATPTTLSDALDYLQTGLDIAGMAPVIGEACDLANAAIHLARGNKGEAFTSVCSMFPGADVVTKGGKFAKKAISAIRENGGKVSELVSGVKAIKTKTPKALPITGRPHGAPPHDAAIMDRLAEAEEKGAKKVRKNQAQLNAAQEKVSKLQPDGQWNDRNGQRHLLQVINTNPNTKVSELLTADPTAILEIIF